MTKLMDAVNLLEPIQGIDWVGKWRIQKALKIMRAQDKQLTDLKESVRDSHGQRYVDRLLTEKPERERF